MKIPRNVSLSVYISNLIAQDRIVEFYQSNEWQNLRREVLREYHYECQECLKRGRITHADCVHHVNEVKHRPDLALSKTYIDKDGKEQPQLIPLCNECHNIVHDKLGKWKNRDKFTNKERW